MSSTWFLLTVSAEGQNVKPPWGIDSVPKIKVSTQAFQECYILFGLISF